jgi:hypothetical protein
MVAVFTFTIGMSQVSSCVDWPSRGSMPGPDLKWPPSKVCHINIGSSRLGTLRRAQTDLLSRRHCVCPEIRSSSQRCRVDPG